jgi:two-component system, sensor histidine kinase PdtaS
MVKTIRLKKGSRIKAILFAACFQLASSTIVFAQYYPASAAVDQKNEPALLSVLARKPSKEQRLRALLDLGNLYFNKPLKKASDLARSARLESEALALSASEGDVAAHTEALLMMADLYMAEDDFPPAEKILEELDDTARLKLLLNLSFKYSLRDRDNDDEDYKKSLQFASRGMALARRLGDVKSEIMAAQDIAIIHEDQQKPEAEKELLDVVARYKAVGYPFLHYTYELLAEFHHVAGNPDKALYYALETLKSMNTTGDSASAGDFYILYALILSNNDEFQQAIDNAAIAVKHYHEHAGKYNLSYPLVANVTARALCKLNRGPEALVYILNMKKAYPPQNDRDLIDYFAIIGDIYRNLKQYDKAESSFVQAYSLARIAHLRERSTNRELGQLYVESGQYEKSRKYLYAVFNDPHSMFAMAGQRHLRYMLFLADSATGHYLSAIRHMVALKEMDQLYLRASKDKEVEKLLIVNETQKKDAQIKIQQVKIGQANLTKDLTIGTAAMLLIILCLLYYQYTQKKRSSRLVLNKNDVITQKNQQLEHLLTEKELLLKEVHHRVKNNLHTIFCLLESQASFLEDDALKAIENSQNRIYAMSLVHQKLYQSNDIATVDMSLFFSDFLHFLSDSFGLEDRIKIVQDVQPVKLNISKAIPLALILNEAVTNAIKYAFAGRENGRISVSLRRTDTLIELIIADNGIGLKEAPHIEYQSLGIELMKGLSEEIDAAIYFQVDNGTKITLQLSAEQEVETDNFVNVLA